MKFIWSYLRKYVPRMIFIVMIKFLGTLTELLLPFVLEHMIDEVAPRRSTAQVLLWGAVMLLLTFVVWLCNVTANRNTIRVSADATYEMRRDLFRQSLKLSGNQLDGLGLPSLISRMTSDSYNVQNFIRASMAVGIRAPVLFLGGIVITLVMDLGLASILCVLAPVVILSVSFISWRGVPLYDQVQRSLDGVVRVMRENITGIRVVKALSKENYEIGRFGTANEDLTRKEQKAGVIMSMPGPVMAFFLNVGLTLVVIIGARRVNEGLTAPGVILAFLTYFNMILMGAMGLNRLFLVMSKANASAIRIEGVIRCPDELAPIAPEKAALPDNDAFIRFRDVTFLYGQESSLAEKAGSRQPSLIHADFSVPKGGSLGIIGATGSGKTTIVNLLMRFYDATEGAVFVDGRDVRTYEPDELRRMFGVVFQNDVIFADTLEENISFGRDLGREELERAAEHARAADFIAAAEDGFSHTAAIRGSDFSGGQRQRLLIARALAGRPRILVLDDSSSALDYGTDAALRKAIRENYSCDAMIVIAQRVSSLMNLDQILVLDEGRIIGRGSHRELMESCPQYREICAVQMGEGEV